MRKLLLLLAMASFASGSFAQEPAPTDPSSPSDGPTAQSYQFELTEIHSTDALNLRLNPTELLQAAEELKQGGTPVKIDTIHLSAIAQHECNVQFGKTVAVTRGSMQTPQGRVRNSEMRQLGTVVKLTAIPDKAGVLLKLRYEASRMAMGGEDREDAPPDMTTTSYETTLMLANGVPTLLGSSTADGVSILIVTMSQ